MPNINWETTDLGKFTKKHGWDDIDGFESWGTWDKAKGYIPYGWIIDYMSISYYFNLNGELVKEKEM